MKLFITNIKLFFRLKSKVIKSNYEYASECIYIYNCTGSTRCNIRIIFI